MSQPRLDDVGRAALADAAAEIIADFRGPHNRAHSTRDDMRWGTRGSLSLKVSAGLWHDFETGVGGDIITFIQRERGCSFLAALDHAIDFVAGLPQSGPKPQPRSAPQRNDDDGDQATRIARALAIWRESRAVAGTLAESYLASRGLTLPASASEVLRFNARCPWESGTRPALIGLITDIATDEPCGIQRVALNALGKKVGCKAMGRKTDGAVKLGPVAGNELLIAEGLETTLSAAPLGFTLPAWSLIDSGNLAKFPVLPGIERLTVAVDHDPERVVNGHRKRAGQDAAAECRARWEAPPQRTVRTLMPKTEGHDLNDLLRECLHRQCNGAAV